MGLRLATVQMEAAVFVVVPVEQEDGSVIGQGFFVSYADCKTPPKWNKASRLVYGQLYPALLLVTVFDPNQPLRLFLSLLITLLIKVVVYYCVKLVYCKLLDFIF